MVFLLVNRNINVRMGEQTDVEIYYTYIYIYIYIIRFIVIVITIKKINNTYTFDLLLNCFEKRKPTDAFIV